MMQKVQIGLIITVSINAIPCSLIPILNNKNIKMLVKVYIMVLECIYVEL